MFRENVLIALTILITLLALSFVILLTVYMQLHQLDEKIKRLESEDVNVSLPEKSEIPSLKKAEQTLSQVVEPVSKEIGKPSVAHETPYYNKPSADSKSKPPVERKDVSSSLITTENPDDEGFYTDDDFFLQFPRPPSDSRQIPYSLYKKNGHVILEVPDSINLGKDMERTKNVLDELKELLDIQKGRDEEHKQFSINGYKPWFPPTKDRQQGLIWFRNNRSTTAAPKRKQTTFDDSNLFNIVNNNMLQRIGLGPFFDPVASFGKRKKRSTSSKIGHHNRQKIHKRRRSVGKSK